MQIRSHVMPILCLSYAMSLLAQGPCQNFFLRDVEKAGEWEGAREIVVWKMNKMGNYKKKRSKKHTKYKIKGQRVGRFAALMRLKHMNKQAGLTQLCQAWHTGQMARNNSVALCQF